MSERQRRISAETLIETAIATLRSEIASSVPSQNRYALAMVTNALEIARRDVLADGDSSMWELLDTVYPEGDGTTEQLARDIRDGVANDRAPPDLRAQLKAAVIAELRIRNPRFLASRGIAG